MLPRIGLFGTGDATGAQWCFTVAITDDLLSESREVFHLGLFVSDVAVVVLQERASVIILDNEGNCSA